MKTTWLAIALLGCSITARAQTATPIKPGVCLQGATGNLPLVHSAPPDLAEMRYMDPDRADMLERIAVLEWKLKGLQAQIDAMKKQQSDGLKVSRTQ